jgi:NADP-dependent 3-hydroxy acid dehydrogenase YdfG
LEYAGGGSGIGKPIALCFAGEGADIEMGEIDADAANKIQDEIDKTGRRCNVHKTDVSDARQVGEDGDR